MSYLFMKSSDSLGFYSDLENLGVFYISGQDVVSSTPAAKLDMPAMAMQKVNFWNSFNHWFNKCSHFNNQCNMNLNNISENMSKIILTYYKCVINYDIYTLLVKDNSRSILICILMSSV